MLESVSCFMTECNMDGEKGDTGATADTVDPKFTTVENTGNDLSVISVDARPINSSFWNRALSRFRRFWKRKEGDDIFSTNGLATTAKMSAEKNAEYYNFNHPKRGSAIIFNHEYFDDRTLNCRLGTNVDRDNLRECFEIFGFDVSVFNNPTYKEIISTIRQVAGSSHVDCDCIAVAVLSHGKPGFLHAKDVAYETDSLWKAFTADRCPSLAGKPKLFFIQACQGCILDPGIIMSRTGVDGDADNYKIPTQADFLIVYSSVPGYFAFRNEAEGSWFIQSLCNELKSRGRELDILTLLTFVLQRVAINFESSNSRHPSLSNKKQIPCIHSRLTRLLRFNEKNILVSESV